jgi:hypothetical protein
MNDDDVLRLVVRTSTYEDVGIGTFVVKQLHSKV